MQQRTNVTNHRNGHTPPPAPPANPGALDVLWDGLPSRVAEQLSKPLDPSLIAARKGRAGRTFPYLEGHAAIAQANRVFGFGGWGYEIVGEVVCHEVRVGPDKYSPVYFATVRVQVPGVPSRTDVGCQAVAEDTAEGHDTAYKGAVTDALKRALRSFGDQFGNALYGDNGEDTVTPALREGLLELGKAQGLTDQRLRDAVRKKTGKDLEALSALEIAPLMKAMAAKSRTPAQRAQPAALAQRPSATAPAHRPSTSPAPAR
jgi:DNA recombination protein Rad52